MALFNPAWKKLEDAEGGVANVKEDAGGFTYRGITTRYYPEWPGFAYIRNRPNPTAPLEQEERVKLDAMALQFYIETYWRPMGLSHDAITDDVATALFLSAVLTNPSRSIEALQDALNGLNFDAPGRQPRWGEVDVDGQLGPRTRMAIIDARKLGYLDEVLGWHDVIIKHFLWTRIQARKQNELFAAGWLRR